MFSAPKVPVLLLRFKLAGQYQVWLGFSLFDFAVALKLHFFGHANNFEFFKADKTFTSSPLASTDGSHFSCLYLFLPPATNNNTFLC